MATTVRHPRGSWEASLANLGFAHCPKCQGYRRNGTVLRPQGKWYTLQSAGPEEQADVLEGQLGKPGLWKPARAGEGKLLRVFDLPAAALAAGPDPDDEAETPVPEACLAWALATAKGQLPQGWQSPPRAEVEAWLPGGALTVQAGPLVRQGALVSGPERLALTFPIVPRVPAELAEPRWRWLRTLLGAGQAWRMVRIGLAPDSAGLAVVAEVDFSGAPPAALECLVKTGLDALRWVVHGLVGSAAFLADGSVPCRALEVVCPRAGHPPKGW